MEGVSDGVARRSKASAAYFEVKRSASCSDYRALINSLMVALQLRRVPIDRA